MNLELNTSQLTNSHIERAFQALETFSFTALNGLTYQQQLFLYGLVTKMLRTPKPFIKITEANEEYTALCDKRDIKPKARTTLYDYLRDFERMGIITLNHLKNQSALKHIKVHSLLQQPVRDHLRLILEEDGSRIN